MTITTHEIGNHAVTRATFRDAVGRTCKVESIWPHGPCEDRLWLGIAPNMMANLDRFRAWAIAGYLRFALDTRRNVPRGQIADVLERVFVFKVAVRGGEWRVVMGEKGQSAKMEIDETTAESVAKVLDAYWNGAPADDTVRMMVKEARDGE